MNKALLSLVLFAGCADLPEDASTDGLDGAEDVFADDKSFLPTTFTVASDAPTSDPPYLVAAAPGEEGQWVVSRLGPVFRTFYVTNVTYTLRDASPTHGSFCSARVAHQVRVFQGGATPGDSPSPVWTSNVPYHSGLTPLNRTVSASISPRTSGYKVLAGNYIYVAVEMVGNPSTDEDYTCVAASASSTGKTWYSANDAAPYGWDPLSSYGMMTDIGMRVTGRY